MGVAKPYFLVVRQFVDGDYSRGGRNDYIRHPAYAENPTNYIRAFELIQKDLLNLFEYIDPSWRNLDTFSFRTFELLLRTCTEIEANFKSILRANKYSKRGQLDIRDYSKTEASHYLSQYEIKLPRWHGRTGSVRRPFEAWGRGGHELIWYKAHNSAKHDRAENLRHASFNNVIDAVCGLAIVISAQFMGNDFAPYDYVVSGGPSDGYDVVQGGYFKIKYPAETPEDQRYDFGWSTLQNQKRPFRKFDYDIVK